MLLPGPGALSTAPPHTASVGHSAAHSVTLASRHERGPYLGREGKREGGREGGREGEG